MRGVSGWRAATTSAVGAWEGDKGVGRHHAHGMRKNVGQTVRAHGTHRADAIRPDTGCIRLT